MKVTPINGMCPCKGCEPPIRHLACHDTCDAYISWYEGRQEIMNRDRDSFDYISYRSEKVSKAIQNRKRKAGFKRG